MNHFRDQKGERQPIHWFDWRKYPSSVSHPSRVSFPAQGPGRLHEHKHGSTAGTARGDARCLEVAMCRTACTARFLCRPNRHLDGEIGRRWSSIWAAFGRCGKGNLGLAWVIAWAKVPSARHEMPLTSLMGCLQATRVTWASSTRATAALGITQSRTPWANADRRRYPRGFVCHEAAVWCACMALQHASPSREAVSEEGEPTK